MEYYNINPCHYLFLQGLDSDFKYYLVQANSMFEKSNLIHSAQSNVPNF